MDEFERLKAEKDRLVALEGATLRELEAENERLRKERSLDAIAGALGVKDRGTYSVQDLLRLIALLEADRRMLDKLQAIIGQDGYFDVLRDDSGYHLGIYERAEADGLYTETAVFHGPTLRAAIQAAMEAERND